MNTITTLTLNPALDIYLYIDQPQFRQLNRARDMYLQASGKGINVSHALAALGIASTAIMPLGGALGLSMRHLLESSPHHETFNLEIIPIAGDSRANPKVLDIEGRLSEFNAPGPILSPEEFSLCLKALGSKDPKSSFVLSGSLARGLARNTYAEIINILPQARIFLDASGEAFRQALSGENHIFLTKPNDVEAAEFTGQAVVSYAEALKAAKVIHEHGAAHVLLSLGAKGAVFYAANEAYIIHIPRVEAKIPPPVGIPCCRGQSMPHRAGL
ncbi:MAG: PfkB family carbohydrate kinase [Deinococcales bacterium]